MPTGKITQAPPWLAKLLTPLIARHVARELAARHPELDSAGIVAKMRADLGHEPDENETRFLEAVAHRLPASVRASTSATGTPLHWYSPSSLTLVAANLVPLYGVLVHDWPVFAVMVLYWLENVAIGMFNALRMLLADPDDRLLWSGKLFMVPFFCLHYGMFTAIHGVFVFALFGGKQYDQSIDGLWTGAAALKAVTDYHLAIPLAALALSHLFSFFWNYLLRGEFRRAALSELMARPYSRVIVLHFTILFGGFVAGFLGSPLWALLLLIALKIHFDLKAHIREHTKPPHPLH
jgi:hypothetical protein